MKLLRGQTLKPFFRSISTTVKSHHNDDKKSLPTNKYLNSWTKPKDPKEAEAKLAFLRREYAKKVRDVRKEYIQEMEVQRLEKMRKDEAKKEAQRIANEERKVAKAAEKKAKAMEREAAQQEFRKTLANLQANRLVQEPATSRHIGISISPPYNIRKKHKNETPPWPNPKALFPINFHHRKSHHNDDKKSLPANKYLNSWTKPKDPKEAEAKLAFLRREYAKKVRDVRKEYIHEMEVQRLEKMRKDEAKKEAQRIANEERKVAKAAEKKAKAMEREAAQKDISPPYNIRKKHKNETPPWPNPKALFPINFHHRKSHHNDDKKSLPANKYLNSWTKPKDPKEAEAKLAFLRREYAKKVRDVRKEYIHEMEVQRLEKMRKDEAKKEAQRIANEERKVAKAAEKKAKAMEREAAQKELR
ncbi:uncharacterized protein LOC132612669 [Lycium barbarum]|uniref:uncharacterized protein LOC132612669 n=1 Tax=Lycium barbarum TaxID=112863 RepID=UPI00293EACCC|nr:uncharacterized protein LOC132612669 [Lycium barbarum]